MKKHQITIVDIARQLNLSKSTVSRALTGHPNVNKETKKAVLELATQLDYQRNMLALSLVRSKSYTLGIIVPEFVNPFFPSVIIGAQGVMGAAGYNVMVCQSNESYSTEVTNTKALVSGRVDGLLVSITKETTDFEHLKFLQRKGIPLVLFNRVSEEMAVSKVVVDDYEGAFRAVEHLILTGRRRIAHLAGPETLLISRNRLNGYLDALRTYNQPIDDQLILHYDLTREHARVPVNHLLYLPHPPDALFAINDPTAIEAMLILKSRGVRIPEEVAVVGFSDDPVSLIIEPNLTTVAQPVTEMGQVAAQLFLDQVDEDPGAYVPETRVLKTKLLIRESSLKKGG
ncbi:MAG: LacI family DNA-binding transcriptional regulator [Ferruginibacter sp.]|nr:LacI family DNA-binding transcriptional regulator [Cytophagales bacterium]